MKRMVFLFAALALGCCALSQNISAQVPQLINYQGKVSVNGTNFNGSGLFKFALVNGGGNVSLWSNDGTSVGGSEPASVVSIAVAGGLFTVLLGDTSLNNMTPIPASVFTGSDVRLRIWFNDGAHGSSLLKPDQRVAAVGYAMLANNVPDGTITGAKLGINAVTAANLAPGAAAANLQAGGQSGVASGGILLSTNPASANLLGAGYINIGKSALGESWEPRTTINAPQARSGHTAIWSGSEMIVWGGANANYLNDGGRYNPVANSWTSMSVNGAIAPRRWHSAVWVNGGMIIWGGYNNGYYLNDGWRYNPATDQWTAISGNGAPSLRDAHTGAWSGSEMIIWGGYSDARGYLNDGARYNPATDSWRSISSNQALSARLFHSTVWTGTELILWGGSNGSYLGDGARYNPNSDTWTPITMNGAPAARYMHVAVWTGTEMLIWGGYNSAGYLNDGARYNPSSDTWTVMSTNNVPAGRYGHTAVWTGSEMVIWGGYHYGCLQDGGHYNPVNDVWETVSSMSAPVARQLHTAVWNGSAMIMWGGENNGVYYDDVSSYLPSRTMYLYLKQ